MLWYEGLLAIVMFHFAVCKGWRTSGLASLRKPTKIAVARSLGTGEMREQAPDVMPAKFESTFLQTMKERGFIHQCTNYQKLDQSLQDRKVTAYLGFDATAKSLHVGSLMQIMILRTLQKCGHKPIVLIGGGTTKVGDPTGKDESRQLLSDEVINDNINALSRVFSKFLTFGDGETDAIMVNNADWLNNIKYLDFLRDYGRHFTINRMLSAESVKQRLAREQPFTFLEFNYMLLQSYDFLELSRRYKASLQLGGSDQWGNIVGGVELARKTKHKIPLFGLTTPLVTTSDGRKMGKTAAGAVWLDKELLPEFDYWQFWRNTADADVIRFLKLFTELPMPQIAEYEKLSGGELNAVKVVLADAATALLHGADCLEGIHAAARSLFVSTSSASSGAADPSAAGASADLDSLVKVSLSVEDFQGYPEGNVPEGEIQVIELLRKAGFANTKSEARRLIELGGARVNNVKVSDLKATVSMADFDAQGRLKLSGSKKKHVLIMKL